MGNRGVMEFLLLSFLYFTFFCRCRCVLIPLVLMVACCVLSALFFFWIGVVLTGFSRVRVRFLANLNAVNLMALHAFVA